MQVLEATKIARKIIRNALCERHVEIWTNKYKHCRTVKCWVSYEITEQQIRDEVAKQLPNATVHIVAPLPNSYYPPSLIIRIPN